MLRIQKYELGEWAESLLDAVKTKDTEVLGVDYHSGGRELAKSVLENGIGRVPEIDSKEISLKEREEVIKRGDLEEFNSMAEKDLPRYRRMDSRIMIRAPTYQMDVSSEKLRKFHSTREPLVEEILSNTNRVDTEYPTSFVSSNSLENVEKLREISYRAATFNYEVLQEDAEKLKDLLESSSNVVIKDNEREVQFKLGENRMPIAFLGSDNLPDGEVFTAPLKESFEGKIKFSDRFVNRNLVEEPLFYFEDGALTDYSAGKGKEELDSVFGSGEEGVRYIGEFGIGLNPEIKHPVGRPLYDEKIRGTVHLAFGRQYEENFQGDDPGEQPSTHEDFVIEPDKVLVDSTKIIEDGNLKL